MTLRGAQRGLGVVIQDTQRQRIDKNRRTVQHLMRGAQARGA